MSNIRVNYSGLVGFIVGISGVFLGLIFTLMITRRLSPEEFGTWSLILSIVNYFLISETIISYWTTRQVARGESVAKTSVISSLMLSVIAIPIFTIYVFFISETSSVVFDIILLGAVLISVNFVSQTLTAINIAHKPQTISYTHVFFEILRIPFAFALVVFFEFGIEGAIFAMLLALLGKVALQFYYAKSMLMGKFNIQTIKRWMKLSWIPSFGYIPNYVMMIDVALYPIIVGSVLGLAYYQAALAVGMIVSHSGKISHALYPKLLAEKNFEGIQKNLTLLLYFAIPLLAISILFSKAGLYALNPAYQEAWLIVIILAIKFFLKVLWSIPSHVLLGIEQVDTVHKPSFSKLFKSNLFRVPTFASIFYGGYTAAFIIILLIFRNQIDEVELVIWWSIIGLVVELGYTIFLWVYSKKYVKFSFPIKNTIKYIIAASIFAVIFFLSSDQIIIYDTSIYKFLPSLILQLGICIGIYIGVTYLIDNDTRILFKSIIREIKRI